MTFEPSLFQTLESSKPIYPPPITTKFLGVLSKANAPVEETIIFSSIFPPGKDVGTEPDAMIIF